MASSAEFVAGETIEMKCPGAVGVKICGVNTWSISDKAQNWAERYARGQGAYRRESAVKSEKPRLSEERSSRISRGSAIMAVCNNGERRYEW